jgi:hypothetical protein
LSSDFLNYKQDQKTKTRPKLFINMQKVPTHFVNIICNSFIIFINLSVHSLPVNFINFEYFFHKKIHPFGSVFYLTIIKWYLYLP